MKSSSSRMTHFGLFMGALILTLHGLAGAQDAGAAPAQTHFSVLHAFNSFAGGGVLLGELARDVSGNVFGTTYLNGDSDCFDSPVPPGCGVIFKLNRDGTETVLHRFQGVPDGSLPKSSLILDTNGTLFGTTFLGGSAGLGTIFKLDASGETVLYSFQGGTDGAFPGGMLVRDSAGNIYGTTANGGDANCPVQTQTPGCGVIFKLDTSGRETVIHTFEGGEDGSTPYGGLSIDSHGNLYGTTYYGGGGSCSDGIGVGCGTVFKLDKDGKETILYRFAGKKDGRNPVGTVVQAVSGILYGTTRYSGDLAACATVPGCGVVFKLDRTGRQTVLHAFTGKGDGAFPEAALLLDGAGNLFGTTNDGGDAACHCGVVFKLDGSGHESVLHQFMNKDGSSPDAALIQDASGNLYGTTASSTTGGGVVFQLKP